MPSKEHLTFESQTPAFLRRLRGEVPSGLSGTSTDPDRHTVPQIRARRPRDAADIEDDEPVYVDAETGNTMSKDDAQRNLESNNSATAATGMETTAGLEKSEANDQPKAREIVAGMGTTRRKGNGPKVVGGNQTTGSTVVENDVAVSVAKRKAATDARTTDQLGRDSKVKKKDKKIKLSFNDDD